LERSINWHGFVGRTNPQHVSDFTLIRQRKIFAMQNTLPSQQRGLSFIGLVLFVALVVSVFVVGAKLVPTVIEHQAILKALDKAKSGNTVPEVRAIFDKATSIDDISSVAGKDLEVTKNGDKVVVSVAYNKEIPLVGPAYLLIKYTGTSK
jgi:hypothetical protein